MDDEELFGGWSPESIERIAARAASNAFNKTMLFGERYDAALGGIVDYLLDWMAGEPPPARDLFKAAGEAIAHESRVYRRDHGYITSGPSDHLNLAIGGFQAFWVTAPGPPDAMAERVTERVAVWQVFHGLPPYLRRALLALADAIGDGDDYHVAAARLGYSDTMMKKYLALGRRMAREVWLSDDETPRGKWF